MSDKNSLDKMEYRVVSNEGGHYSLWPAQKAIPTGWKPVGPRGKKDECLLYIDEVWSDMRPLRNKT